MLEPDRNPYGTERGEAGIALAIFDWIRIFQLKQAGKIAKPILIIVAVFSCTLSLTGVAKDQAANNREQSFLLHLRELQETGHGRGKAQRAAIHDLIWKAPLDRRDEFLEKDEWHKGEEAKLNSPNSTLAPSDELPMALDIIDTELVSQVTGADSLNHTALRWGIYGTDLGHMFWHRDKLYMVFGDTFGEGGLGGKNWRSNALARLADPNPAQGLRIEAMITGPDGAAKELIPSRKIAGIEKTVIPTHGISADGRMYLHYMSVRRWGENSGQWDVRHSGFAYSDNDGQTWYTPRSAVWSQKIGFEQVALVHGGDGYIYTLGIPGGRWGGIRLRRVLPHGILDPQAYEYWNGESWVADPKAAVTIIPPPVGELSVAWSTRHRRWLMMYLNPERHAVVLRTAPDLTGPWAKEQVVVTAEQYPGLYAPYIVPVSELGDDVYFTLSMWGRYNVFLMHMSLQQVSDSLHARNDP